MNQSKAVALLLLAYVFVSGCGSDPKAKIEKEAVSFENAIREALTTKPTSVKVRREELEGKRRGPVDVVHVVLEYGDDNRLDLKGLRCEANHRISKGRKLDTTITISRSEGDERIAFFEMEFYYLGDTMHSLPDEATKGKIKALQEWCWEIRKVLVKVLPNEPRPRNHAGQE
jgi:hypothetical protein